MEFNALVDKYPDQDQWVVTAYARIAECYENEKKYGKAAETYNRILKYTKVKQYRVAAQKHLKALKAIMAHAKAKKAPGAPGVKLTPVLAAATPEAKP